MRRGSARLVAKRSFAAAVRCLPRQTLWADFDGQFEPCASRLDGWHDPCPIFTCLRPGLSAAWDAIADSVRSDAHHNEEQRDGSLVQRALHALRSCFWPG